MKKLEYRTFTVYLVLTAALCFGQLCSAEALGKVAKGGVIGCAPRPQALTLEAIAQLVTSLFTF